MSSFSCPIVQIGKVGKHPNADLLGISHIQGYPCIVKLSDIKEGDKAVYIPEESFVPESPMFSFLWAGKEKPREKDRVVYAKRLRGIFSMGLLLPIPETLKDLPVGTDISQQLGIEKYEKPEPVCTGGDNNPTPGWFQKYTDIEHLRKYPHILQQGEEVVITEKTHGANGRFVYREDQLYVGSHNNTKKDDGKNMWWILAKKLGLEEKLKAHPNIIIYGEVYGQVQKGFDYGVPRGHTDLILFDAFRISGNKYLDEDEFLALAESLQIKTAPILYRGPWLGLEQHESLADGPSVVGGTHFREGFVVKPTAERWENEIGRTILKLIGQEYLLSKNKR